MKAFKLVFVTVNVMASVSMLGLSSAMADGLEITPVATGVARVDGQAAESQMSAEFAATIVAAGAMKLENPSAINVAYGYAGDGPMVPAAGDTQTNDHMVEASKTEPDKNTYLVLSDAKGPDANYNYGTHFVFQGHEAGAMKDGKPQGYITRVNLDADEAHRVTLMADTDTAGNPLVFVDGSTYNPFAQRLLFTGEEGDEGGVWQATTSFPSKVESLTGVIGIGSYEGIQADKDGNLWIVEDAGGKVGNVNKHAKQPNSFIYRFIPTDKTDLLKGGKLEALQVSTADDRPLVFTASKMDDDILSPGMAELYSYGKSLKTNWVVVHDTAKDGTSPFKANDLAKSAMATPMKRPENGVFRPGSSFGEFYFTATGDTNIETEAKAEFGGFGGIFKITQGNPSASEGTISLVYRGDAGHTGFDNIQFASANELLIVEDAGDKAHSQRKAYDAGYVLDLSKDYATGGEPTRFLALGRDPSATMDSTLGAAKDIGFQNSGDNEITGIHVSDGDASVDGLLGAKVPNLADSKWRMFYSQQHGDNRLFEVKYNTTM